MLLLLPGALAQDVSLHESLATGSSATTVYGGTFTGAGWRVDDSNSRMFWDFGTQVERGSIEVVIDDIDWDNLTLANNHLIELFDSGGHWTANRAINLRVYGGAGPDEWGQVKLKCWEPNGVVEARTATLDWDGAPHLWKITWDDEHCALYKDGAELLYLETGGLDLRVGTLWLPLNDWIHDYSAPIGTLYSNLRLAAWEEGSEDDPVVPDDGDPLTFSPIEDVSAASWEADRVYSEKDDLCIETDGSPLSYAYVMFDLSTVSGKVTSATLALTARQTSEAAGDAGTVYAVAETGWDEDTLTWNGRPAVGSALGSFGAISQGDGVEIDVTAATRAGGRVAFAVASGGGNSAHFSSKEDGDGSGTPMLRIAVAEEEEEPGADTDTNTDTEADSAADAPEDTGRAGGSRSADPNLKGELGGGQCGCAVGAPVAGWGVLLALSALRRSRRWPRTVRRWRRSWAPAFRVRS